jgi:hypothetical protein
MTTKINANQLDIVAAELEAAGTDTRQLSIKGGGVAEGKLGFSWVTVEILASAFSESAGVSTYNTLAQSASSNGNVLDNAELLRNGVGGFIRVAGTPAATGEWSLSGTTLSIYGDVTAEGSTFQLRYVTGTGSGPSSASGNQVWLGLVPQVPPETETDYFTDNTLDPKWTEFDIDGNTSVSEGSDGLELSQASHGGSSFGGVYQTAPADDQFAVTAELRMEGPHTQFANMSVFMAEDSTGMSASSSFVTMAYTAQNTGPTFNFQRWSDYNTFGANILSPAASETGRVFVRLWVDRTESGGTIYGLVSPDGREWVQLGSVTFATAAMADLDYIGIGMDNSGSGITQILRSSMFRVDTTTDKFLPVGGFVGTSVAATTKDQKDVTVAPNNTVNLYGWADRRVQLIKVEAFSVVPATVGAYTMALAKGASAFTTNLLSAATFDMTSLSAYTPTEVTLTSTADDRILEPGDVWRAQFVSDDVGLDAAGVYFQLTWLVL